MTHFKYMPGTGDAPIALLLRGPDLSGAVLLPSPRPAEPLQQVDRHFRNAFRRGLLQRRQAHKAWPEEGPEERGQNATPNETLCCHSGYRVDSCCDRRNVHRPVDCSTSRRARPIQTA